LRILTRIRRTRFIPVWAPTLTLTICACVSMAALGQSSTGDATEKEKKQTAPPAHHTTTAKAPASSASATKSMGKAHTNSTGKHSRKKSAHARGQQKIDSERAQAIQEALIREHYLSGEATGTWNQASEDAMRRYQADHGWQSKTVPDSRALIKLGLGPSKDHLLNPESAMTTVPDPQRTGPSPTTPHNASPATDPPPAPATPDPGDSSHPQ
jgi:Putative peptidoglycan binding domain